MTTHPVHIVADGMNAIIDASSVTTDAASVIGDTGKPVADTCAMSADAEMGVKDSRSIAEGLPTVSWKKVSVWRRIAGEVDHKASRRDQQEISRENTSAGIKRGLVEAVPIYQEMWFHAWRVDHSEKRKVDRALRARWVPAIAQRSNPLSRCAIDLHERLSGKTKKWRFARWFAIALGEPDPPLLLN